MSAPQAHDAGKTSAWLRELLADRLGIAADAIAPDARLHRYGLTSLTAASIVAAIAERTGRTLAPTLIWDYPTLDRLAGFLDGRADAEAHAAMAPLAADDPIAIVGMACRLPGAESLDAFWRMLGAETDAIREVPAARWPIDQLYDPDPLAPGRMATRWGGFLDRVDEFDAGFFGMSPREAAQADPQQRLALELAWESLEDAAIRPSGLLGSRTGVFLGAMWSDYARLLTDRDGIAQHTATGQDISIISARIAYTLGLEGPALTIDTACSSALVAVHQACQSLRIGETTMALAGGVHLLLAPESSIAMTKFGAMAPDGRCKAFDSRANGYVRGEGGGVVVLKPLSAARADGDRVYAVIRGSAMNNDGPSNGLTAPNPAAQRGMLRDALDAARVHPHEVDYVEAHGTGTALGDPIEANALAAILCRDRPDGRPLRIGSVKTNIGHLEAAAGAAGLIKLALALRHRWIPASLHFQAPNPAIDFAAAHLEVQAKGAPWPTATELPIAGVSSFGFGGTNCHVLLQAVPAAPVATSAGSAQPVFVFSGNGGNWAGMARGLMQEPVFAATLQDCDRILTGLGYPASVLAVLESAQVSDVALGQPALCAFQLALADLLKSWGVVPSAVIGHSVGEAAAAVVAGALSRDDGLRLVVERSRLQAEVAGHGGMALAGAPADSVRRHLPAGVVIAGENGPRATLLAGTRDAINAACAALDTAGIASLPIDVPVAYHSPQMDPLQPMLRQRLAMLTSAATATPMVSTVTGAWIDGASLDADYWAHNLREPVRFRQGVATLVEAGHRAFLELAPHPLLAPQLRQMAAGATVVSPIRRDAATPDAARTTLAPLLQATTAEAGPRLLVLSARSPAALDALARRWAERLPADWAALCHTALVGRERFEHRLAVHAVDGETAKDRLLSGDYRRGKAATNATPSFDSQRAVGETDEAWLDRCAAAFVAGAEVDATAFGSAPVARAPTYPFERERHWLGGTDSGLSYEVAWEPVALPDATSHARWPDVAVAGDPADAGLDVEAVAFARAAMAAVPAADVLPRHRALIERLATWQPLPGPAAAPGPARDLLRRVGEALPALLTGEADPLEILFPGGDIARTAPVYAAAPFAAAQKALADILGKVAGERGLNVLELGAGTGALTAQLLPVLPAGSTLVCSDVSMAFLATLRQRFPDSTALRTAEFDLDRPAGQEGPFDAIVAANVVHAAAPFGAVLAALRKRLAPGGILGLVELVRAPRWIDLVFGITDGWWRFRGDPARPDHALLDRAAWRTALAAAGFTDIDIRSDNDAHAVILARAPPVERLWQADDRPAAAQVDELVALAADPAADAAPLAIVHGDSVAHAAVAGATRALMLDHPHRIARSVELADTSEESVATLHRVLDANILGFLAGEEQFRVQKGVLQVARLARTTAAGAEPTISPHLIYVVAGGFGRLGRAFARFLIDRGARHLLLVGRSAPSPEQLSALQHGDVLPRGLALDLTAPGAAATLRAAFDRPLGGMIHAAGLADGPTAAVLAAKLDVAATLERAADGQSPAFLLLFSSAGGVWGSSGHAAYAAANRALDRWAEQARRRGFPATAIAFGRFEEPGLLSPAEDAALDKSGLRAMRPAQAFAAALQAAGEGVANRVIASVDWPQFRATFEARRRRHLFDRVAPDRQPAAIGSTHARVPAAPVRLDRAGLAALVAELLGHADPARIDPDRGLFEQGMDSLLAVSFRRRLEDAAGVPVPAAIMFAHPTLNLLAGWLAGVARVVPAATGPATASAEPIAIVGMGCRFAGGADTPAAYLARLMTGLDAVGSVPETRPTAALWQTAPLAARRAGFLDGVERFAAAFFGISPREAVQLDPQQRLLLEVAWHALENARIAPASLNGKRAGVFVGATGSDYAGLARARGGAALDAHSLTGQPSNTLAGRLAYQFGLHGPAMTVDTACSSSLVALHLAVRALRSGEADLALAGGVNLLLTPDTSLMLTKAGLLAADGRCKVFDAAANGYVRGEGCGVVVLKRLSEARRDGDRVLATIRGSALNHDGRSSSFTAPNGAAQAAVIRDALADAGLAADTIDCIEAHGTGTELGDPIELDALTEVFAGHTRRLPVGSVKAMIGHTEAAAGIAAVIKMVLCLRAGALPPQPHFVRRNPHARTDSVVDVATGGPLPAAARFAGVSAFGASGTNAHVVIDRGAEMPLAGDEPPLTPFDREAFWLPDAATTTSARHPTLGEPHRSARSGETVWQMRLGADAEWLGDHMVEQFVLMPAAGFLDMARRAGIGALIDVEFRAALDIPPNGIDVQLVQDRQGSLTLYAARGEDWTEIATARIDPSPEPAPPIEPAQNAPPVAGSDIEFELSRRGFGFGPSYRLIESLSRTATVADARLRAAAEVDPPTIDAALQTLTSLLPPGEAPLLPARIGRVVFTATSSPATMARARLVASAEGRASGHAMLSDRDGATVLALHDVELRAAHAEPGAWFHDLLWRPAAAPPEEMIGRWHAIGPGAASLGTASHDETGTATIPPCDGIVDLRPLAETDPATCIASTSALVREAATHLPRPRLLLVSRGASTAPPVLAHATAAASVLMGLQPVIDAEHPDLRCRWIDLDSDEITMTKRLAGAPGRYAIRQGRLLTPEIVKAPPIPAGAIRLMPGPDRSFADLQFLPLTAEAPGAGEVLIAVSAAGLNFKDVLSILGRTADTKTALGLECAGTIVAVGPGVRDLAVGDAVLAFGPGALASEVTLPANRVVRRPKGLGADVAASLPVACLTAWHGLHDIAAIEPGMCVLVHAGAGGVGSMATAIARLAGARVFATASAGKEQAALRAGAEAVGDSRSPGFADAARRWAGADGFDIVLNALGPEIAAASAALLKRGGIFLEIGNAPAPAGGGRHVAYDLDGPMRADPAWFADRMAKILTLIADGRLAPPRRTVLPLAQAEEALQALGQGRTVGKLVLRLPAEPVLRADATYIVTGGTGGVGRALAGWLADKGAGRVVLAARHAAPDADARLETVALDVTDGNAVAALFARLPNVRGVIHAAGVVSDSTLALIEPARIAQVLAPKVGGARHLDAVTRSLDLDFFVLVSSTAGSLAAPGQAAYAGANAWLDALAAVRRAAGLPASAIAFGPWATGMYAALNAAQRARLERDGFRPMAPRRAAVAFARVLADDTVHRLVMDRAGVAAARTSAADGAARTALLVVPPADRRAFLQADLERRLITLLGFPAGTRIGATRALRDLGLDSLLSVSLRNELTAGYSLDLQATVVFDHPTLAALAVHLLQLIEPPAPARPDTDGALDDLDEAALATLVERELAATP